MVGWISTYRDCKMLILSSSVSSTARCVHSPSTGVLHAPTETTPFNPDALMAELDYYGIAVEERHESPQLRLLRTKETLAATLREVQGDIIDGIASIAEAIITEALPHARQHCVSELFIRLRKTDGTDAVALTKNSHPSPEFDAEVEGISTGAWERTMATDPSRTLAMLKQVFDRMAPVSDAQPRSTVSLHVHYGPALKVTFNLTPAFDGHFASFLAALDKAGSP